MVAVKAHEADAFLKALPPKLVAFLLYGTDEGAISERAAAIAKAVAARTTPPGEILRIDDLDLEREPDRIATELKTISMFGDRRVVRAEASRRVTAAAIAPLLDGPLEGVLVIEAGNLKPDEGFRALFEKRPDAAAIACYADEARDLDRLIQAVLSSHQLEIATDARQALAARLGADRAQSRAEIEKLALYAYGKPRIELSDVEAVTGDASELALEGIVAAAVDGRTAGPQSALAAAERAFASGESPQALIIVAQRYIQRLHRVRAAFEQSGSMDQAIRSLRPPLHFKARDSFSRQVQAWTGASLLRALDRVGEAQKAARSNVLDDALVADRLLLDLARFAAVSSARQKR